jgi:hypothetical protein
VLSRLSRIAGAARGVEEAPAKPPAPPAPDTRAVVAAAQAFAERTRLRSSGMAA